MTLDICWEAIGVIASSGTVSLLIVAIIYICCKWIFEAKTRIGKITGIIFSVIMAITFFVCLYFMIANDY